MNSIKVIHTIANYFNTNEIITGLLAKITTNKIWKFKIKIDGGINEIKVTKMMSLHGITIDLLERLLNIILLPCSLDEMVQILAIRCATEIIEIEEDALAYLATKGIRSLRYVV